MVVVEVRAPDHTLIEIVEVSISADSHRIMITDDQGHQVFVHRDAWMDIIKAVGKLLMEERKE